MNNTVYCKAIVFDVDATLVDTMSVIDEIWLAWANSKNISFEAIANFIHGRKVNETLKEIDPAFDNENEINSVKQIAIEKMRTASPIVGALEFVNSLPKEVWGIATSGPENIATTSLKASGFCIPNVMVCGEHVTHGKPHREPFELAVNKLGFKPNECIAFEDSPAGVQSAKAAGCFTVALTTSHSKTELYEADLIVNGYSDISAVVENDQLAIRIDNIGL